MSRSASATLRGEALLRRRAEAARLRASARTKPRSATAATPPVCGSFGEKPGSRRRGRASISVLTRPTRKSVKDFHAAALTAGGRDNGAPGLAPTTGRTTTRLSRSIPTATASRPIAAAQREALPGTSGAAAR